MNNEFQSGLDPAEPHEDNPFQSPAASASRERLQMFGAFWASLGVAVLLGVMLILIEAPGLAILWGMLAAPGFLRAYIRLYRQRQELGRTQPPGYQLLISALSVLLLLPLMIASLIAGGVVCTAGVLVSTSVPNGGDVGVLLAFGGGGLALLATYIGGFVWSLRWKIPLEMKPPENPDAP